LQANFAGAHPNAGAAAGTSPARAARPLRPPYRFALHPAVCFATVAASIVTVSVIGKNGLSQNLLWVANGILMAYLLLAPRWRRSAYLCAGFAGLVLGSRLAHQPWTPNLLFNTLDLLEILLAAHLLRRKSTQLPRFTQGKYLLRFLLFAVFGGPLLGGLVGALISDLCWHRAALFCVAGWLSSDCLGMAITCPVFVAMLQGRRNPSRLWRREWIYLAILGAVTGGVFTQSASPTMFLIYPVLIMVLLRMGLGWASFASLFVAFAGGWSTAHGAGPLASTALSMPQRALLLQLFIACAVFMIYSVSVVLDSRRSMEQRLAKIAALHQLVTENSRDAIILADFDGNRSYVSAAAQRLVGWPPEEFAKVLSLDLVHPDDLPAAINLVRALRSGHEGATIECRVRTHAGAYLWVEASLRVVRDARGGSPIGVLNIVRDISERKIADAARAFQHSVLRAIHEVSPEGILVVNRKGDVVSYNRRFTEVWRFDASDCSPVRAPQAEPIPGDKLLPMGAGRVKDAEGFLLRVRQLYANPGAIDQCEIQLLDGRTLERYSTSVQAESGQNLGRVWFFRDISATKRSQKNLENAYSAVEALASTDPLTGLANRRRFDQSLSAEWRRGLRDRTPVSLLMIDVDQFKSFNDDYGHLRGDSCLRQVAEAAQDIVARPGDVVARFGGEEFAIILPNTGSAGAMQLAEDICEAMRRRQLPHRGNPLGIVTVSVGCATMAPAFGLHAVSLVESADQALYLAKNRGRNQVCNADSLPEETLYPTGTA
jgi:diguanylate cyclase (GGDEF)-like protein/PAS domain S-box-containing protein